jgi:ribosome-associated translation inhibitor RaiA
MSEERDFPIVVHSEADLPERTEADLIRLSEESLRELAKGHQDIIGATVNVKQPAKGRETSYIYETTVTLNIRPENIAATEKSDVLVSSLTGALAAVERQVRKQRQKLRQGKGSHDALWLAEKDSDS